VTRRYGASKREGTFIRRIQASRGAVPGRAGVCRLLGLAAAVAAALSLSACGDDSGGGPVELSWFIFNEPSGVLPKVADDCSDASGGEYTIKFEYLPAQADAQREQLVRRLGAEDDSIDIIGMDVIWTGEFANAGWLEEWTGADAAAATDGVFQSMVDTATFEDKLWAAPIWTNTQLLWYRKDRVPEPPQTWDEMFKIAGDLGSDNLIQVQGNRYEGLVVWFNSMAASAGTTIVEPDDPEQVALEPADTNTALATMAELANSPYADSSFSTSTEDSARLAFESGNSAFMLNYPFVYPSAKQNAPEVFKNLAAARYPRVVAEIPSKPPLGGIILGVSAFSKNQPQAFDAIKCLIQPENQLEIAAAAGVPPVVERLYKTKDIEEIYPGFADLMRESIKAAAPRPVTPAYQDLALAIQRVLHPVADIDPDDPTPTTDELRKKVETALKVEGLL
jgi:multiple sugar transport system substrate-binding protein